MVGLLAAGQGAGLLRSLVKSSIGKKLIVGLTGFCLCGFLVVHLGGNLLLYKGDGASFNAYATALSSSPLVIPAEIILAGLFLAHIGMAIRITLENRKARPDRYAVHLSEGGQTLASRTMIYSGLIVLAFLVLHLYQFRFGGAAGETDLYKTVKGSLGFLPTTAFYVVAVIVLGVHVSHGLQSAFRTLGLVHPRYTPIVIRLSQAFGAVVALGFGSMPIWALITK